MFNLKINNQDINFKITLKTLKELIAYGDTKEINIQGATLKGINALLYELKLGEPIAIIDTMKITSSYKITDEDIEKELENNTNLLLEFKNYFEEEVNKSGFLKTPLIAQKTLVEQEITPKQT